MMNTTLMKIHTVKMKKIIQNRHLGRLDFPGKSVISTCLCLYVYIFVHTCICICIRISSYRVKMRSRLALKLTYPKPKSAPNLLPSFTLWRIHNCICGSICIRICGSICIYISPYHDMTLWDCCNISNISQVSSAAVVLIVCVSRSCKAGSHVTFEIRKVQQVATDGFGAKKLIPFFYLRSLFSLVVNSFSPLKWICMLAKMDLLASENGFARWQPRKDPLIVIFALHLF